MRFRYARHYNLNLGRFLSPDPAPAKPANPQSWNAYTYVLNNPVNLIDPLGLTAEPCYQDSVAGDQPCFQEEITVTAKAPVYDFGGPTFNLGFDGFSSAGRSRTAVELFADLRRQPRVGSAEQLITTMSSFECEFSWDRVFANMETTNSFGLSGPGGIRMFNGRKGALAGISRITGTTVAELNELPTFGSFIFRGGWRGMTLGGATFSGTEVGVLAAGGAAAEYVLTYPAWEGGVFVGSVMNETFTMPCHYGN